MKMECSIQVDNEFEFFYWTTTPLFNCQLYGVYYGYTVRNPFVL